ncbi:hypothetical protein H6503_04275 [Candidatus Woesearchaeota archaeon]|nr:hypothetical protein [Candidatus Woesearchaeota archaeon]
MEVNPLLIILYGGSSFNEMSWQKSIAKSIGQDHLDVLSADSSLTSLSLLRMFWPDSKGTLSAANLDGASLGDYLMTRMKDENIIVKANGIACQPYDSVMAEMKQISDIKNAALFYTVATVDNTTGENHYNQMDCPFLYHFLSEILLLDKRQQQDFSMFCDPVVLNDSGSYAYEIGFKTEREVEIADQYCMRNATIPKGIRMTLHRSYRYSERDISIMADMAGADVLSIDGMPGSVALYIKP